MSLTDKINFCLCVFSFILAAISVITVIVTIRQNSRMIEVSTRPYLCVYGEEVNTGSPAFYFVVKNCGSSVAHLTRFSITPDLSPYYHAKECRNFLSDLNNAVIAPGQARICCMNYAQLPDLISVDMTYHSDAKKIYSEHFSGNIKTGAAMLASKYDGDHVRGISYTLQDLLLKKL